MALFPLRGVLVEYGKNILGPIPNIVVFQFNPEKMTRTISMPPPPPDTADLPSRESNTAAAPPMESFSIVASFSAADDLGAGGGAAAIPAVFGIGPQLAALEKMVYPPATPGGLIGAAIDAVASAIGGGGGETPHTPVPRVTLPRILFIWGPSRVLPVRITSMSIAEQKYDALLNPVQAEVTIGMEVSSRAPDDDPIGKGAYEYTQLIKDTQATLNLVKVAETAVDIIAF